MISEKIIEKLREQGVKMITNIPYDPDYTNHYKETLMDYFNNQVGRGLASGSGSLYQLVENAIINGDLRYLNNLLLIDGFYNATDNSVLTPTNQ